MTVKTYIINEGTRSQYYGLMTATERQILHYTPKWKTEKGAINWAKRNGFTVA